MKLIEIKDKEILNKFLTEQKYSQFLQSWEWGEFQKKSGFEIRRFGVEEDGKLSAVATLIKKNPGLKKAYWYCPRGPVVNFQFSISDSQSIFEFLIQELAGQAKKEAIIFLRIEPLFKIQNSKFKIKPTLDVQPFKTLILNLEKSEEELLARMHQKTRYNIRLANKKGIEIKILSHPSSFKEGGNSDFEKWWEIMEETEKRDKFRLHNKKYYQKMLSACHPEQNEEFYKNHQAEFLDSQPRNDKRFFIKLIVAKYQNKIIAGNIIAFFGGIATYIHGASSNEYRNLMAPYLLQWEAIKLAKRQGLKFYDFYGIDENKWPGVTRFKKGFGGKDFSYPGTFDLVFNNLWYNVYKVLRKIRRLF